MKLLLTSAGITNPSIHAALVDLLGRPIHECRALCIPTASYPLEGGARLAWNFVAGREPRTPMVELGWKSVGILELTALPSLPADQWVAVVREADVLLVNGGDAVYLGAWMRRSGLADLLPSLGAVYVGLSGGSLVMAPGIAEEFAQWTRPERGDEALAMVDFAMFPHLDHPELPDNSMADAERWAGGLRIPGYAIDDQTAIRVVDGMVDVVSEGHWRLFAP